MKRRLVTFGPEARRDLRELHDWIARKRSVSVAAGYLERIRSYCEGFEIAPERGSRRDDIRSGLRIVGFERRIAIAFTVEEGSVSILRILYGGRDLEGLLS